MLDTKEWQYVAGQTPELKRKESSTCISSHAARTLHTVQQLRRRGEQPVLPGEGARSMVTYRPHQDWTNPAVKFSYNIRGTEA